MYEKNRPLWYILMDNSVNTTSLTFYHCLKTWTLYCYCALPTICDSNKNNRSECTREVSILPHAYLLSSILKVRLGVIIIVMTEAAITVLC